VRRGPIPYSTDEMAWLEENRMMVISDYCAAFVAAFGRDDVTLANLHQLRKRKGWKVGRDSARYIGRLRTFSAAEIAWLRENFTMPISEYHKAFQTAFDRADMTPAKLHALRKRQGWKTGRTGQFEPGLTPFNKGQRCPEGVGGRHPNARRTQFQKGSRTGKAARNYQLIGTERISQDGYRERKVHDGLPMQSRWQLVQRIEWEAANGPVPDGHALKCLDGNRLDTDPSNWEAIPRAVLARLNGGRHRKTLAYDDASTEVKPLVMALAKLKHAAREARERSPS